MTDETNASKKPKTKVPLWGFIVAVAVAFMFGAISAGAGAPNASDYEAQIASLEDRLANASNAQPASTPAEESPAPAAVTSFGDGLFVVGTKFPAGVYATDGPTASMCYYAWMSTTGSDSEIISNEIVEGASTVTLVDGEIFKSNGCSDWVKIG